MQFLRRVASVTLWNLQAIPARWGASLVICIGIAGVVVVLVTVLAMATGLERTLASAGRDDRALVLRRGALAEVVSALDREIELALPQAPGVARLPDGRPAISPEVVLSSTWLDRDGEPTGVGVRGITPVGWVVRDELRIVRGRAFRTGMREVVVGTSARQNLRGAEVGDTIEMYGGRWTIVGEFESRPAGADGAGDVHESELLADAGTLMSAAQRTVYSSATIRLAAPGAFDAFARDLKEDPRLKVTVDRETDYYAAQSEGVAKLLFAIAYVVGGVMALGAMFGALVTMYSAVADRTREIATLRALGFGSTPVVVSVIVEALALALVGAAAGAGLSWLAFDGSMFATSGFMSQVAMKLQVDAALVGAGVAWGAAIGFVGGLLPALRAARLPVIDALRER